MASSSSKKIGLVLSGGGSRAAYQVGALRALADTLRSGKDRLSIVVGTSIGAVNSVILGGFLRLGIEEAVEELDSLWRERTFRNTFLGSPSRAFLKAIQVAILRYSSPGPVATSLSIFDPTPLRNRIDAALMRIRTASGGAILPYLCDELDAVGVMATIEGKARKPLLFVCSREQLPQQDLAGASFAVSYVEQLTAAHGLASSALPSVLPPVRFHIESEEIHFVDGGICDNFPIDPAVRMGAQNTILIDTSGRRWWFDHYREPHDTRPTWEVISEQQTFCMRPEHDFQIVPTEGFGKVLKQTAGRSTRDFIAALGPTWPIFRILQHKMGEELAYEVLSYVALHPSYFEALLELGYEETKAQIKNGIFPM